MHKVNPEHITTLLEMVNNGPYFELLSMKVCAVETGYSKVEIDLQKKHCNPFNSIHGGVYASLIDTAAYWSVYCELDENIGFTSIDLSVNNFSMIREGKIIAEGKSIKIGKSICVAEAIAKNAHGKLLAHGISKLMILNGKQSIKSALESIGHSPLPPKFI